MAFGKHQNSEPAIVRMLDTGESINVNGFTEQTLSFRYKKTPPKRGFCFLQNKACGLEIHTAHTTHAAAVTAAAM